MQEDSPVTAKYTQKMHQAGLRNTHVRQQIFAVLQDTDRPLTIQEIVASTDNAHFVSVYRSIDAMRKADIVKMVPQGFKNLFELSDDFRPHHHHATCELCGKTVELQEPELEALMSRITKHAGLLPTKHHFELFGICSVCATSKHKAT